MIDIRQEVVEMGEQTPEQQEYLRAKDALRLHVEAVKRAVAEGRDPQEVVTHVAGPDDTDTDDGERPRPEFDEDADPVLDRALELVDRGVRRQKDGD